jgi:signal transduction histidine kinase
MILYSTRSFDKGYSMEKDFKNDINIVDKDIQELPNNLKLSDNKSVEFEEISLAFKQILATDNTDRLFDLFDTTIAVLDMDGNILVAKKWQKICTDFHRVNAESCQKCLESDTQLANDLEEGKEYTVYRCKNGMVDCASPIIIEGHHIANVYVGQFLFEEPDLSFFRANAKKYGFDEKKYMEALSNVPIIDEKSQVALHYLTEISKFISVMALEKIRAMKLEKYYQEELNKKLKEEIEKNRKKDLQLIQQSRLAQMGEMIGMIAHQWRQPLSIISMDANNMLVDIAIDNFNETDGEKYANNIILNTQHLSDTINDFRNFYKPNKSSVRMRLDDIVLKSLKIIKASLLNENIEIIQEYNSKVDIELYDSELMQVVLNILKNAQDNFKEKHTKNPYIKITTENKTISICDNGGGISKDVIEKIFDPYFSTKNEKNGTGLGLYMSKTIVQYHHGGKLSAKNTDNGVCLTIEVGTIQGVLSFN